MHAVMHATMPWPTILLLLAQHTRSLSPQQARRTPHAGYHGQGQTDFFVDGCVEINQ